MTETASSSHHRRSAWRRIKFELLKGRPNTLSNTAGLCSRPAATVRDLL